MKIFRNICTALFLGCSAPILVWVGAGAALYQSRKTANLLKRALPERACSIDSDCPPGFACVSGRCMPQL